jgi:predicted nicotinamide N-methyase
MSEGRSAERLCWAAARGRDLMAKPEEEYVRQTVELPGGDLRLLQPSDGAEIPDDHQVEWAPLAPYWSILWRSGVALARELSDMSLQGRRVVELGCGLAVPSLLAAREGGVVLATDARLEPLELAERNADANGLSIETAVVEWTQPDELIARGPFDLVLAADVLYERRSAGALLSLLPRLAPEAWIADPGRPPGEAFFDEARRAWAVETSVRDPVTIYRLRFDRPPGS